MTSPNETVITELQLLIAEEMHLLAQELEDSLDAGQSHRLGQLSSTLDNASALLTEHRATRPN